jgi:ComF family protein
VCGCVCRNCWVSVRPITAPLCDRCGDPLARAADHCPSCNGGERVVDRSRAVGEYEGNLREIIHAFKYDGRRSLAQPLAALMRSRGIALLEDADCVVPVPLHWRREYQRGFNQARELARHLGPPIVDALVRQRHTRAQVELAADRRRSNVENAFAPRRGWLHKSRLDEMSVVVVDDVSTTGATLEACARVLKAAGASEVYALTAARVVTRRQTHRRRFDPGFAHRQF